MSPWLGPGAAEAFAACERQGWAFLAGAVREPATVLGDVHDVGLAPLEPEVGAVTQAGASGVAAIEGRPLLTALADELAVASGGWRPDEVALGRYGAGDGISPHRDNSFYVGFVAVLTVAGEAPFRVLGDRAGQEVLAEMTAAPGDLVLLRGPREGAPDARPFHQLGPPAGGGERTVLVLRRNRRGAGRGWA